MAEGWLKTLGGDRFRVYSAGIEAHGKNPRAIAVMQEAGVDISGQASETVQPELLSEMDLMITVCSHADAHCPELPVHCRKEHWPFHDPAKATGTEDAVLNEFRSVRDQIRGRIVLFLKQG